MNARPKACSPGCKGWAVFNGSEIMRCHDCEVARAKVALRSDLHALRRAAEWVVDVLAGRERETKGYGLARVIFALACDDCAERCTPHFDVYDRRRIQGASILAGALRRAVEQQDRKEAPRGRS